ncbi:MAG: hypothetical protein Ta2B_13690 [Termitinemataceae bacterium]|nr:MAG: hypothetical protein Ta2B_13690 [Termitinemataceae bacterium]
MPENKNTPALRFAGFSGEWEENMLGNMVDIGSASRVHKEEWKKDGVRFFRSSDVVSKFMGKKNEPAFISNELYEKLSSQSGKLKTHDILVTGGGTIGIPYLVEDDNPLYFKDGDLIWIKNSGILDGYFLFYTFASDRIHKYILSITHTGTISHYTIEQGKATPLSIPQFDEQSKIGTFFRTLDTLIKLQQREFDKTVNIKKAMLQKMFPKAGADKPEIRFAGFSGGWEERKLGDVAQITMGQSPSGEYYTTNPTDNILVQGNADMKNGRVVPRVWTTQVTKTADMGDIILSVRAPVGDVGKTDYKVVLGRGVAGIKGNEFVFQILGRIKLLGYWNKLITGSTFESINSNVLKEAVILVPSEKEQQAIGSFFTQLDTLINLQQREIGKLQNIKKALLEKMFV